MSAKNSVTYGEVGVGAIAGLLGFVLVFAAFYPGLLSSDAVDQLGQARSGNFNNWHPPIMGWIWARLEFFNSGQGVLFVAHNLVFWAGLVLTVVLTVRPTWLVSVVILVVGLWPPIFSYLGTILKDVGMFSAFLLSFGLVLLAERRQSKLALLCALPFLYYGFAVRHNGPIAALPLLGYWVHVLLLIVPIPTIGRTGLQRLVMLGLITSLLFGTIRGLNQAADSALVENRSSHAVQQLLIHDLTAISVHAREVFIPDGFSRSGEPWSLEELDRIYEPNGAPIYWGPAGVRRMIPSANRDHIDTLEQKWLEVIPTHLRAYLSHRVQVFAAMLGITHGEVCASLHLVNAPNNLGIEHRASPVADRLVGALRAIANSLFFRGWLYGVVLIASLLLLMRARRWASVPFVALGSSGLAYQFMYLWASSGCYFRFNLWPVLCAMVLSSIVVSDYFARRSRVS